MSSQSNPPTLLELLKSLRNRKDLSNADLQLLSSIDPEPKPSTSDEAVPCSSASLNSFVPTTLVSVSGPGGSLLRSGRRGRRRTKGGEKSQTFTTAMPYPCMAGPVPRTHTYSVTMLNNLLSHTTSTVLETFQSFASHLSDLPNFSQYQVLFDSYRINKFEIWIVPRNGGALASAADTGRLVSVIDYDDDNTLPTVSDGIEYQTALFTEGSCCHYRACKPMIAVAAYAGAFTSYASMSDTWIDCANPTVAHYGYKVGWSSTSAATIYDIFTRTHVEFKCVR